MPQQTKPSQPKKGQTSELEGEGSTTATRQYNKHVAEHLQEQDVEQLAQQARDAAEGEQGEELKRAEELGKRGPAAVQQDSSKRVAKKGSSEKGGSERRS